MKKLTLVTIAAFAVISMSSCKKDRTCTCTQSTDGGPSTTTTVVVNKTTKNAALGGDCASGTSTSTTAGVTHVTTHTCALQ